MCMLKKDLQGHTYTFVPPIVIVTISLHFLPFLIQMYNVCSLKFKGQSTKCKGTFPQILALICWTVFEERILRRGYSDGQILHKIIGQKKFQRIIVVFTARDSTKLIPWTLLLCLVVLRNVLSCSSILFIYTC